MGLSGTGLVLVIATNYSGNSPQLSEADQYEIFEYYTWYLRVTKENIWK